MEIKISLAQMEIIAGQPKANLEKMIDYTQKAKNQKADIIVFPELSLPGYMLGDLWEYEYFLHECEECGQKLIEQSKDITIIFGNIAIDWKKKNQDGRVRKYNACFVAKDQKLQHTGSPYPFYIKAALPNYREFEDSRHFFSSTLLCYELSKRPEELIQPCKIKIQGEEISLGCMICEDGWTEYQPVKPPQILAKQGVDIFINISSSPYAINKNNLRHEVFTKLAKTLAIPIIYTNHTGVQNSGKNIYAYDGESRVYSKNGDLAVVFPSFHDELCILKYNTQTFAVTAQNAKNKIGNEVQGIFATMKYSLISFLVQNKITKMVVGLSGGIDSAVSAALFTHILGPENVLLINMPGKYNSPTTIGLAKQLAQNLNTNYAVLPVEKSVKLTASQIQLIDIAGKKLKLSDFALENVQARDRSSRILAAAASAFVSVFSCNANKSEITIGYGTFYGDLAGAVAPLADLWKHQVYELGHYLNERVYKKQVIPNEIFEIMPSAELSPEQTVGTGGDPLCYPYHDYLFKAFVEEKLSPVEIASYYEEDILEQKIGCEQGIVAKLFPSAHDFLADLEKWWLLLGGLAVAKRIQAPPIVTISQHAYGLERRESQLQASLPEKYMEIKNRILKGPQC